MTPRMHRRGCSPRRWSSPSLMRVVVVWACVVQAPSCVVDALNRNSTVNKQLERKLIDLQLRAGALTSRKTNALALSPWEIGSMPQSSSVVPDIGFYRIIGCPLPPRHDSRQLWDNLKYLMEHEPPLKRVRKIFVLNRLDSELDDQVRAYVESFGHEVLSLPLHVDEYRPFQMEDTYGLAKEAWDPYLTEKFSRMNARLYVMNNNGARNFALRDGLKRGWAWTLPFDGNCIFSEESWALFLDELDEYAHKGAAYVAIPLARTFMAENGTLIRNGAPGEHQVAFSSDAKVQFDPTQPYGHRPKVNLLWRLGVPGVWDNWVRDAPFRAQEPCELKNHRECGRTWPRKHPTEANRTWVSRNVIFRLPDGAAKPATGEDPDALGRRAELRDVGTMRKISDIDKLKPTVMVKPFRKPLYYNVMSMESMRRECLTTKMLFTSDQQKKMMEFMDSSPISVGAIHQHHCAQIEELVKLAVAHLKDPTYSVVDKKKSKEYDPPEGATLHDYQRLGIYDWRIRELPLTVNASDLKIPPAFQASAQVTTKKLRDPAWRKEHASVFVGWDGHARTGADIGAPHSDQFDRTRSYDMLSNVTLQALAYFYTGRDEFAEKATRIARVWFVNETTAQAPNMNYAQFSKRPEKAHFGVIATKDLAYMLDALWLVTPTKYWSQADERGLQNWCSQYMAWLDQSNERKSPNNHGWYYLTQYLAVAKCAGKQPAFLNAKVRNHVEKYTAPAYIAPDTGLFVLEAERSRAVHYHFYSFYAVILAWRALSNLGARELMDQIRDAVRPTLKYLDAVLSNATDATCLSFDDEFASNNHLGVSSDEGERHPRAARRTSKRHLAVAEDAGAADVSTTTTTTNESVERQTLTQPTLEDSADDGAPRIRGCVPRPVALEYAAPVCQWAFDDDHTFAETLAMCRRHESAPPPPFPVLGTGVLENYIVPPFMPTYPHMGYFPFTNLMW